MRKSTKFFLEKYILSIAIELIKINEIYPFFVMNFTKIVFAIIEIWHETQISDIFF